MLETQITRHSFFVTPRGTERFTEHAPLCIEEPDHQVCNCTRAVTERPAGELESVTQIITFSEAIDKYQMRLYMTAHFRKGERFLASETHDDCDVGFTASWPKAEGKPPNRYKSTREANNEHAHFRFVRKDHAHVQVTGTGDNEDIDCTLGDVLFGDKVDTSRFFNGFSQTRLDLSGLTPEDVWVHRCCFGSESWARVQRERGEAELLWRLQRLAARIRDEVAPRNEIYDVPSEQLYPIDVREVRSRVTSTQSDSWYVHDAFLLFEKVLAGFQDVLLPYNDLWKALRRVDDESREMMIARSKERK